MSAAKEETTEPDLITFHINRYDFTIPRRYYAGHSLTEGEAKALNQLMAENVRNNVSQWVRKAEGEAPAGEAIPPDKFEDLQSLIHAYAITYQFQSKPRQRPVSAADAALDELAFSHAEKEGHALGYSPDSVEVRMRYRQLLNDPVLKAQARAIVADRTKLADASLSIILGES